MNTIRVCIIHRRQFSSFIVFSSSQDHSVGCKLIFEDSTKLEMFGRSNSQFLAQCVGIFGYSNIFKYLLTDIFIH